MSHEEFIRSQKRRIEVGCLSGHWTAERIDVVVEDQVVNMDEEDEAARGEILAELRAHLAASWARAAALEAALTERTKLDRLDDALRDLAKGPHPLVKAVWPLQQDDPNDETCWFDENDPLEDPARGRELVLRIEYDGRALHARGTLRWPHDVRRADFQPVVEEVIRVLGVHGIAAAFDESVGALVTERFPYQKRRTTKAPPATVTAPPAPAKAGPCSRCGGKGWIKSSDPSRFPEICACKRQGPKQ
jgi:hypothetical protein